VSLNKNPVQSPTPLLEYSRRYGRRFSSFKITEGTGDEGAQSLASRRCSISKSFMLPVAESGCDFVSCLRLFSLPEEMNHCPSHSANEVKIQGKALHATDTALCL